MAVVEHQVRVMAGETSLEGNLSIPPAGRGLVIFAHGSGSSRLSPRNRRVAARLNAAGLAMLLFDLLTPDEAAADEVTAELRFDIPFLASRLSGVVGWAVAEPLTAGMRIGLFGASTGAAAALVTAADRADDVAAVVCRGGRPDLAGEALPRVAAPTLLIVGGEDRQVIELNRRAAVQMTALHRIEIIPGATHLFEEPGTLERVADLACGWFARFLPE